jgi:hypothetical protein
MLRQSYVETERTSKRFSTATFERQLDKRLVFARDRKEAQPECGEADAHFFPMLRDELHQRLDRLCGDRKLWQRRFSWLDVCGGLKFTLKHYLALELHRTHRDWPKS